jgi:hypothetical protein
LWLYDKKGYPSGTAGGLVLKEHAEWQARGLLVVDTETDGGAVNLQAPPGRLFRAAAFPVESGGIDLNQVKDLPHRSGTANWTGRRLPVVGG